MQTKDLLGTNATVISVSNGLSKEDPQVDRTLDDVVFPVNATHFRLAVEVKVKIATDSQIRNQWQRLAIHDRIGRSG